MGEEPPRLGGGVAAPCPPPQHSPDGAVGPGADRGEVLVALGHLPHRLVQLLPVKLGPLLRHRGRGARPARPGGRGRLCPGHHHHHHVQQQQQQKQLLPSFLPFSLPPPPPLLPQAAAAPSPHAADRWPPPRPLPPSLSGFSSPRLLLLLPSPPTSEPVTAFPRPLLPSSAEPCGVGEPRGADRGREPAPERRSPGWPRPRPRPPPPPGPDNPAPATGGDAPIWSRRGAIARAAPIATAAPQGL